MIRMLANLNCSLRTFINFLICRVFNMPEPSSGITWFEDDDWIGSEITFKSPTFLKWKITQKIAEHENCMIESEVKNWGAESSCRGVFICSSIDHSGKEAALKIRMP